MSRQLYLEDGEDPSFADVDEFLNAHFNARAVYISDLQRGGMTEDDIRYLEKLAYRLSAALYYGKLDTIGIDGSVSTGLRHDDYDFLRGIVKKLRGVP